MNLQSLIQDLGIDKMPEEKQKEAIASLIRTINNRMSVRMADELSEDDFAKLERVTDDPSTEELEKAHPGFMKMYQEEINKLREDFKTMRGE